MFGSGKLLFCAILAGCLAAGFPGPSKTLALISPGAQAQDQPSSTQSVAEEPQTPDTEESPETEDLAPAEVQLDVSHVSPLIQVLYQATRETKEGPTLDRLAEAKKLIENGSDVKAADGQGRTALHWAVFGSS